MLYIFFHYFKNIEKPSNIISVTVSVTENSTTDISTSLKYVENATYIGTFIIDNMQYLSRT